jgi:hypothetical protein
MTISGRPLARYLLIAGILAAPSALSAQRITTPREHFGFAIGDDYRLANYTQFSAYWEKLARESNRMVLDTIGRTAEGRVQLMAIVSSPDNLQKRARYREIAEKLARAEGVSESEARALAREGKAIVWIDGGLHSTEVLGAHQLIETVYRLISQNDEETMRFLNDCIILAVHANPDGMELVSNWYMRNADSTKRVSGNIPRLYQKYIGHDNNRDFYLVAQPETENISRVQFRQWYPQIIYNHHQTGPAGAVMFAPPFRDPHNYQLDPLVLLGIDLVGTAMHTRFVVEDKPGIVRREGASYQTWWNGGLRTVSYFHNMVGLLTETIGNPTPIEIPFTPAKLVSSGDYVYPITPQKWHFRQSIEYSVTANRAVLDVASRHREQFLFNIWKMGNNAIEKGKRDTWTTFPRYVAAVQDSLAKARAAEREAARAGNVTGQAEIAPTSMFSMLRKPELRDPRGFVIPSDQADFATATKFVNALMKSGVTVHRATRAFTLNGKSYPAGSYAVSAAQAFRAHVLDMFEPQDYPNDLLYPGGPPKAPYDAAGYTLAYQMGIKFDRHLDGPFEGPFERIEGLATPPAGTVARASGAAGFLFSHQPNDAFVAVNRLMKAGNEVYWLGGSTSASGRTWPAGTFYVPARSSTVAVLQKLATDKGLGFEGVTTRPAVEMTRVRSPRVALWDTYGGSMPSGWTRWILEQYEFPFDVVYPQTLDAGNLNAKYDVIVLPDGSVSAPGSSGTGGFFRAPNADEIPAEFRGWLGRITPERTVPQLRRFVEGGGRIVAIGSGTNIAYHLGLPVGNHLVERTATGEERPLPRARFYVPGSVLQVKLDTTLSVTAGMPALASVMFDESPVFRLSSDAASRGVRPIAWFDGPRPLQSGWAWGQQFLAGGIAAAEAKLGQGTVYLFGPEILFRAQPHGTFKLFFNSLMAPQSTGSRTTAPAGR